MKRPAGTARGPRRSRLRRWLILNLILLSSVGLLSLTYPVEELSRRLGDFYFRIRGALPSSPTVVLVLIDDASLSKYGRWPWPRALLARMVRAAAHDRPKALGLDIILSEPGDANEDRELAEAFRAAGNVVLATKISGSGEGWQWGDPLPLFSQSAAAIGHVQAVLGPDGICRSIPENELSIGGPRLAFAVLLAKVARRSTSSDAVISSTTSGAAAKLEAGEGTRDFEQVKPRFIYIDYRGQILPEQTHPPFTYVLASDLLEGRSQGRLTGKVVLIGFAATDMSDRMATPVSDRLLMPGVEVHANVVDGLLAGRHLQPVGTTSGILLVLAASLFSTLLMLRWPGGVGLIAVGTGLLGGYAAGYFLFTRAGYLIGFGPLLLVGLLAGPLVQLENLILVERNISRGLRQIQTVLHDANQSFKTGLHSALRPEIPVPSQGLHWKVELLNQLQTELSSLYALDQALLETMQDALAVYSVDGRMLFGNPRWTGFCERHYLNPLASLAEFGTALRESSPHDLGRQLAEPGAKLEKEIPLGNGLWQVRVVRLPSGAHLGAGGVMVVVADLTARLERDHARAEALGFVTHELRTPLVSIQGFAEFLLRYPQAAVGSGAAETIFRESKRLVAMINTYLDVLRLDSGSKPLLREPVAIRDTVTQVGKVVQPLVQAADMRLITEVASHLPPLIGDSNLIAGALLNLLSNAVKYSPRGSSVTLRVMAEADSVVFEVRNPGPVIPAQDLARLFDPFYRRQEQEDSAPGWGLGLAFVKRIAESHGGRVEAASDAENGTLFRVILPSQESVASSVPPDSTLGLE
ncbi:MAG TPA: CHASE2 domain-containing protein [Terriglobia bacterium]|nr:CHASE2 domain-containing protein [Terriglobia bacterium]